MSDDLSKLIQDHIAQRKVQFRRDMWLAGGALVVGVAALVWCWGYIVAAAP